MKLEINVFHSTLCLNHEQIAEKVTPFLGGTFLPVQEIIFWHQALAADLVRGCFW